jgi:putative transposon-encoded protein
MANVKITDLTAATTPLAGTELFETVQGGSSKKVAASDIGNSATAVPFLSLAGRAYIQAYSNTDQTGSVSAATAVKLENTDFSAGISITNDGGGNPTRITFAVAGTYMLAPSIQFKNVDTNDHDATVWFRKNGTNIANSATIVNVPKAADGGATFFQVVVYEQVTAGQYIEIMWLPEDADVTLDFTAAGAIAPAIPSIILVSERIA